MLDNNIMQVAMQPYLKLVRSNLELLTKFSTSPEMTAQATASAQSLLQQGQESAAGLAQSNAFAQLVQGMLKNYTVFLTEVGQVGKEMFAPGPAAMTRQIQETSERIVEVSKAGERGVHQID